MSDKVDAGNEDNICRQFTPIETRFSAYFSFGDGNATV